MISLTKSIINPLLNWEIPKEIYYRTKVTCKIIKIEFKELNQILEGN